VTRRIAPVFADVYWTVRILGTSRAAIGLNWVLPRQTSGLQLGAPAIGSTIDPAKALVIEAVLTFFLVRVFASSRPRSTPTGHSPRSPAVRSG
jgi:hypothetical protein